MECIHKNVVESEKKGLIESARDNLVLAGNTGNFRIFTRYL